MRRILAFVVFLILGIVLFSWVVQMVGWKEIWEVVQEFWGTRGALLLVLTSLMLIFGIVRWREVLRHQGYSISLFSLVKQYLGSFAFAFFVPMVVFGSELFRSYTLKEFHGVPLPRAMVSVAIERILEITSYALILAVGIAFLLIAQSSLIPQLLWWILISVGVSSVVLILFYIKSHRNESIVKMFFPWINGNNGFLGAEQEVLHFFTWRNRAFWEGLFLSFAKVSMALLRTFVLAGFLGKFIGFFPAVTITAFSFLSLLVPIPGQLGSHEALQVLVFQSLEIESHLGAAFAFLIRASEIVIALVGIVIFFRLSISLLQSLMVNKLTRLFQKTP